MNASAAIAKVLARGTGPEAREESKGNGVSLALLYHLPLAGLLCDF